MIEVDDRGGLVEIWIETTAGRWLLVARSETRLAALVEAERLVREDLMELHALLDEAKQAETAIMRRPVD